MTIAAISTVQRSPGPVSIQDDEPLYEIIDGQRVELPPMSILACRVASRLMGKMGLFLDTPLSCYTTGRARQDAT
jgi:hypothetical protein